MGSFIDYKVFLISFAIGLLFVYVLMPQQRVIMIYPNPENVKKMTIKDFSNSCFSYTPKEVVCPKDESRIKKYNIHGGNGEVQMGTTEKPDDNIMTDIKEKGNGLLSTFGL